jgi:demethylmenaquinone methyltransferase/2-methoxy-6-polyprenyl-1,4-benzoquinol methylase
MFAGIAARYDFLNHFLSLNIDKRWRRRVAAKLREICDRADALVLDAACGTGDLSFELQRNSKARILGTDFCHPMLVEAGKKNRSQSPQVPFIEGDAMNLSFGDETFDAVTIAFGLRNLSNFRDGLSELRRILKRGGRLVVLEFSSPVVPGFRQVFDFYFNRILPRVGGAISGSRGA